MCRSSITINSHWRCGEGRPASSRIALIEAYHRSIPGFRATPLIEAASLAGLIGASRVYVKHEYERLGLPSFKVVGASWAINCAIAERLDSALPLTFGETTKLAAKLDRQTTLTAATDGNHGRAVAHIGRVLGVPTRIYVAKGMAPTRIAAIAAEGSNVIVVHGSYNETVQAAASEADANPAFLLVSDTSWPGYQEVPMRVAEGYGTIFSEASRQLMEAGHPSADIAFIPAGVGALASAAVSALHESGCVVVTVEPSAADCVRRSLEAGRPVSIPGPHTSLMAGLNCGEVSHAAWPTLRHGVRAAVAVTDDETIAAVRMLAALGIRSGASGAAALAGALVVAQSDMRQAIYGGNRFGVALLLDSEGVTDPDRYAEFVT